MTDKDSNIGADNKWALLVAEQLVGNWNWLLLTSVFNVVHSGFRKINTSNSRYETVSNFRIF
jgi:hypothetical protein